MIDVVYVAATIGFFSLMLAYVRGCEALARDAAASQEPARGAGES